MFKPTSKRISKDKYEINITGNRDYRSPDVDVHAEVTSKDELHITIPHTQRCYGFDRVETCQGYTKIIMR